VVTHKKKISEMNGLGRAMPFTFGAFALAALSMIGTPPVGGFISKLYLIVGALDAGSIGILVVLVASSLLNAAYFAPVVYHAFFSPPAAEDADHPYGEAPPAMLVPLCLTAAVSVIIGFCPDLFLRFAQAVLP
jgi:multicomponent Na+:H+ antiporter subunit D